jgi:hypothetical protein
MAATQLSTRVGDVGLKTDASLNSLCCSTAYLAFCMVEAGDKARNTNLHKEYLRYMLGFARLMPKPTELSILVEVTPALTAIGVQLRLLRSGMFLGLETWLESLPSTQQVMCAHVWDTLRNHGFIDGGLRDTYHSVRDLLTFLAKFLSRRIEAFANWESSDCSPLGLVS